MRADIRADTALNAVFGKPGRNVNGDASLFESSRALRERTVGTLNKGGNRKRVTELSRSRFQDFFNKLLHFGSVCLDFNNLGFNFSVFPRSRNVNLDNAVDTFFDGSVVKLNDVHTLLAVRLGCGFFHQLNCLVSRNDLRKTEESGLKNRVDTTAESELFCDVGSVDGIKLNIVLGDVLFHRAGKIFFKTCKIPGAVEKERTARNKVLNHRIFVDIGGIVASDEVCLIDQVSGLDRGFTETKVRNGDTAGLLRVVGEVALCVHIGVVADDLDGVLVGTYGTVSAEAPELTAVCAGRGGVRNFRNGK